MKAAARTRALAIINRALADPDRNADLTAVALAYEEMAVEVARYRAQARPSPELLPATDPRQVSSSAEPAHEERELDVERLALAMWRVMPMTPEYHSVGSWFGAATAIAAEYARLATPEAAPEEGPTD